MYYITINLSETTRNAGGDDEQTMCVCVDCGLLENLDSWYFSTINIFCFVYKCVRFVLEYSD